ncbi:MAG TPA: Gfo/Idh/MocA family oxidoreductase, partial [Phnomibacter sp.]|nr:Gfo/Idh/MocA family oxidoreductase [Phnomibacter sp.]
GLHVLCEKPMAIRHTDACQMADAAALAKRHLLVVKQNRFNPPVAQVKEWLQQGLLGEVHFAQCNGFWHRGADYYKNSWRGKKAEDGGTLYTQFSHFIDVLIWFLGPLKPLHVQTQNQQHQGIIETDDCGTVIFQFGKKGILSLQYTVNAAAQNMEGSITLIGTKGTVKIGGQYLNELSYCAGSIEPPAYLPPGNPPNAYGQYTGSMSNHPQVYTQFLQLLQEKWSGQQALQEAIETVKAIEEVYGF